jgi:hypothetical protein
MPYSTETDAELRSLVFNCFVFCQICERWSGLDLWLLRLIWRGIVLMRA